MYDKSNEYGTHDDFDEVYKEEKDESKCDVRGCKRRVTVTFPLLVPEVNLCNYHHVNPPNARLRKVVNDSNESPDDFDEPDEFDTET